MSSIFWPSRVFRRIAPALTHPGGGTTVSLRRQIFCSRLGVFPSPSSARQTATVPRSLGHSDPSRGTTAAHPEQSCLARPPRLSTGRAEHQPATAPSALKPTSRPGRDASSDEGQHRGSCKTTATAFARAFGKRGEGRRKGRVRGVWSTRSHDGGGSATDDAFGRTTMSPSP